MIGNLLVHETQYAALADPQVFSDFTTCDLKVVGENTALEFVLFGKKPFTEMGLVGDAPKGYTPTMATFHVHGVTAVRMERWKAVDKDYFWNTLTITTDYGTLTIHLHSSAVREDTVVVY